MTWILASDWSPLVTWPEYWPLIGHLWERHWTSDRGSAGAGQAIKEMKWKLQKQDQVFYSLSRDCGKRLREFWARKILWRAPDSMSSKGRTDIKTPWAPDGAKKNNEWLTLTWTWISCKAGHSWRTSQKNINSSGQEYSEARGQQIQWWARKVKGALQNTKESDLTSSVIKWKD